MWVLEKSMLAEPAYRPGYSGACPIRENPAEHTSRHSTDQVLGSQNGKHKFKVILEEEVDAAVRASSVILDFA